MMFGFMLILMLIFVIASFLNATAIVSIKVILKKDAIEPKDHSIFGIGRSKKAPDYKLLIRKGKRWFDCGTLLNTSAKQGIIFPVKPYIPVRQAVELRLIEDDKIKNDELERLPIKANILQGHRYTFEIKTKKSLNAGLQWFFSTPIGKAASFGISLSIVIIIVLFFLS